RGERCLERSLLDLPLGIGVVAGQDVAEVVEDHPLGEPVRLAGEGEPARGAELPVGPAEGSLWKEPELLVAPGDLLILAAAEEEGSHELPDAAEALRLRGLAD